MSQAPWLFCASIPAVGASVTLDEREARHATGSKRRQAGDAVVLFDGAGVVASAELVESSSRRTVEARVTSREERAPLVPVFHLASALPKGDRQGVLLSMATQLGMTSFTPLLCARSIVKWTPAFAERAARVCLETCKQSRNAHPPEIRDGLAPAECANASPAPVLIAHPGGRSPREIISTVSVNTDGATLMIGPEGGFTDEEVGGVIAAGGHLVDLGSLTLRIETAAVALLSVLRLQA